tara:strand:+ start:2281 stop:2874 length:594 start_codon:yes stop_codon:yes gene_type:complete
LADVSFAKEVREKMSVIDVGQHIKKRGRYNYLPWSWAWDTLTKHYPESSFDFKSHQLEGGTWEVECFLSIRQGDKKHEGKGWLPVMDHKNQPIKNPASTDLNNTKMRAWVKAIAIVTGLGLYIFAGEDMPEKSKEEQEKEEEDARLRLQLRQRLTEQVELLGGRSNVPQELIDLGCSDQIQDKIRAVEELDKLIEGK